MRSYSVQFWDGYRMAVDSEPMSKQKAIALWKQTLPNIVDALDRHKDSNWYYVEAGVWKGTKHSPYKETVIRVHSEDCVVVKGKIQKTITEYIKDTF